MLSFCLKCKKDTENIFKYIKMCSVWQKKSKFIKDQEVSRFFDALRLFKYVLLAAMYNLVS